MLHQTQLYQSNLNPKNNRSPDYFSIEKTTQDSEHMIMEQVNTLITYLK